MQNQSSHWLNVRRDRPDWMIMWGWGAMNPTAVKEAAKINFPMDKFVGVWWSGGEDDARAGGAEAKGYQSLNFNAAGADFPAMQDIMKHVVDKGKSQVAEGQGRRDALQPRRLQLDAHRGRRSATRRRSPARRSSPARTCGAASRPSTSPRRA